MLYRRGVSVLLEQLIRWWSGVSLELYVLTVSRKSAMNAVAAAEGLVSRSSASLEQELLSLNAHMSAATWRFLVLVRTFAERVAWGDWGMRSMAHWLNWRCGIDLGAAREQVRVAHALAALPLTSQAMAAGKISGSKVRALSRVANSQNEDFFLGVAEYGTASHLEKTVRLVKAIRTLESSDKSVPFAARRASALAMVAEAACVTDGGGVSVPEIMVHVQAGAASADDVPADTTAHIEDAVAISTTTAERLCCDAAVVPMLEGQDGELLSIGRRSRTIPPAIRRATNARGQGCRFPGCTHTRCLHGHHIRHWAHQGEPSLANLVTLCSYHHTLVHEGGFSIMHTASGDIACFTPTGRRVEAAAPARGGDADAIIETNSTLGLDVSAATCDSKWDGLPADYDLVLTAFCSRPDVAGERARPPV